MTITKRKNKVTASISLRGKGEKSKNLRLAVLLGAGMAVVYWLILRPQYGINDDVGMANIAYGIDGQGYHSHLVYINLVIGVLLKALLTVFPAAPWYAVAQCIVILLSFSTLLYLLLEELDSSCVVLPVAVLILFFGYNYFARPQFSMTAGIATVAGGLSLFSAIRREKGWLAHVFSGALLLTGSLYRFSVFELMLAFLFGVGLHEVWPFLKERNWKRLLSCVIPFAVVLTLSFSLNWIDRSLYRSREEWRAYSTYNALRSELLDLGFPDYAKNKELYTSLNISEKDLTMFRGWNFADPEVFNVESMQALVDAKDNEERDLTFGTFVGVMAEGWSKYAWFPAFLLSLGLAVADWKRNPRAHFLVIYVLIAFWLVNYYMFWRGRYLKSRVDINIILCQCMILLLYCQKIKDRTAGKAAGGAVLLLLLLLQPSKSKGLSTYASERTKDIRNEERMVKLDTLLHSDIDRLYFNQTLAMPAVYDLWDLPEAGIRSNRSSLGGWMTMLPARCGVWQNYKVQNPYRDAVDSGTVRLICPSDKDIDDTLAYIRRHYAKKAYSAQIKTTEDGYKIFRILSKDPYVNTNHARYGDPALHCDFKVSYSEDECTVKGEMYAEGVNSYAADIYLETEARDGTKRTYCVQQKKTKEQDDLYQGEYGTFSCTFTDSMDIRAMTLYLDAGDRVYAAPIDTLDLEVAASKERVFVRLSAGSEYDQVFVTVKSSQEEQNEPVYHEARRGKGGLWYFGIKTDEHGGPGTYSIKAYAAPSEDAVLAAKSITVPDSDVESGE